MEVIFGKMIGLVGQLKLPKMITLNDYADTRRRMSGTQERQLRRGKEESE